MFRRESNTENQNNILNGNLAYYEQQVSDRVATFYAPILQSILNEMQ